ncbi:CopM family metallochaperone [Devosia sp. CN2-171]|uniref:CopM family metallochaperone n=1 Tax=Devosia sp. CN2-171 TaxID=3400909 RepID=UPI003BF819E2
MLKQLIAALALATLPGAATAQEPVTVSAGLPAVCTANAGHGGMMMGGDADSMMGGGMAMGGGDAAHTDLMDGMGKMNADMMAGGTATDIDVAFVCSMIPHHRGAIDMAKAELAHGDDPWAKELATAVIAAQEKEIADMLAWLEKQGQ